MKITAYRGCCDIDIQFENGAEIKNTKYTLFRKGSIMNPNIESDKTKEKERNKSWKESFKTRIGETSRSRSGEIMTIIDYRSATDLDVQFEDGTITRNRTYRRFKDGSIGKDKSLRVGETVTSTRGQTITLLAYRKHNDVDVEFEDGTVLTNRTYKEFKSGNIKNPNFTDIKRRDSFKEERLGETNTATNGQSMKIIAYRGNRDIDIEFEDGTIVRNKQYIPFTKGNIENPNKPIRKDIDFTRIGEKSIASNGQTMTIIDYRNSRDVDIRFEDGTVVQHKLYQSFLKGYIRNPNKPVSQVKKELANKQSEVTNKQSEVKGETVENDQ
jgi:hypothetical protein